MIDDRLHAVGRHASLFLTMLMLSGEPSKTRDVDIAEARKMFGHSPILAVLMSICCTSVQAQTAGGDHDTIRTVAGALTISKVEHMAGDGVAGHVDLDGKRFDELYGSRHMYYPELDDKSGAISRMVMEDFSGGFSDPPSVSLYDFRRTPPAVVPISSKLDINDVRWQPGKVLLHAGDKWYTFANGKLSPTRHLKK